MSEEKKSNVPAYIQNSMQSVEGMLEYANMLLKSKLCPSHFYEKGEDNKPDYTRGKPEAVLIVLQHGMEVGLSVSQSLQQVVPVNGLISIKGDGAKSLIFKSGVLKEGSWKEDRSGSIENEDYSIRITSTRKDNGITKTSEFSVAKAKRAGLWVSKQMVEGKDGWKYKYSPWFRYQERMIDYRCLGFHARDHYPDILAGMYTLEEAQDMPQDTEVILETPSGAKVTIPDSEFVNDRSKSLTERVTKTIEKKAAKKEEHVEQEKEEEPQGESYAKVYTEDELTAMDADVYDLVEKEYPGLHKVLEAQEGRKSKKKYVDALLTYQEKGLAGFTVPQKEEEEQPIQEEPQEEHVDEVPDDQKEFEQMMGETEEDKNEEPTKEEAKPTEAISYRGINITLLPESGSRPFPEKRAIFQGLINGGINNDVYKKLAEELVDGGTGETYISRFGTLEEFARAASPEQIKEILDTFKDVN